MTHTLNSDVVTGAGITLGAHWANFGGVFAPAAYWKDSHGHVHVEGVFQTTAAMVSGETIFTLPLGYRPTSQKIYMGNDVTGGSVACRIDVTAAGAVTHAGTAGARVIVIPTIHFLADA